jgi:hypothetical protein
MKISKIAIAALFAAGLVTASASAGFAEDEPKPQISIDCIEGYSAVYSEDGSSGSCEADAVAYTTEEGDVDVKPIDSCWETENGINVCARGGMVPMPASTDGEPIDPTDCMLSIDADGNEVGSCEDIVLYDTPGEDGSLGGDVDESVLKNDVDETLMFQSGVGTSGTDNSSSNALAAFGVLVAALGALGIGISRQKDAK